MLASNTKNMILTSCFRLFSDAWLASPNFLASLATLACAKIEQQTNIGFANKHPNGDLIFFFLSFFSSFCRKIQYNESPRAPTMYHESLKKEFSVDFGFNY